MGVRRKEVKRKRASEAFYIKDGKRQDANIHNPILDNPEARDIIAKQAVKRAMQRYGFTREEAERAYGPTR